MYLPVPLKSGQRIYGVRLDLTTHNWAFRHGTLYAALLDADGNAVANGELDCITIKDNTFATITFDAPYTAPGTADAEADYDLANPNMTLRLWYTPGDDWDVYHLLGLLDGCRHQPADDPPECKRHNGFHRRASGIAVCRQ